MDKCPKKDCHEPNALIFRKIVIPASIDDDSVNPPKNGAYCNALVYYEATGNSYIYSSDGIPTKISTSLNDIDKMIDEAVGEEASERKEEDQKIWDEIEVIEAGSDVVDVVGTYAELQQYDTSKLLDGDIIKVLQDETRDDAITYYRWATSTSSFTYVGSEGPYYTESQVDTLLGGKQDTLIAGSNIQIAADGKTISATDTTYTHFTGATASADGTQGLVPAPVAGDQTKFLAGDGTWQTVQGGSTQTIFYMNASESGSTRHLYKSSGMTGLATMQDIIDANEDGQVIVRISTSVDPSTYSDMYLQNAYVATGDYQMIFLDNQYYYSFDSTQTSDSTFQFAKSEVQRKLTAGTNIQINGNTISATDTTYSDFTGASSLADGAHGLVPAPLIGDEDKYLKGDGTWGTVQAGSNTTVIYRKSTLVQGNYVFDGFYADQSYTERLNGQDIYDLFQTSRIIVLYRTTEDIYGEMLNATLGDGSTDYFTVSFQDGSITEAHLFLYEIDEDGSSPYNDSESVLNVQPLLTAGANISIGTVLGTPNTISVTGMPVLYGSQGQNTDGAVTQKVFTDTVGDIESILQTLNSGSGV